MSRPQSTRTQATDRIATQRAANLRLIRTVMLGAVAVTVAIVWLGDQYGIDREETFEYLLSALLFVAGLGVLGLLGFGCLWFVRRWLKQRNGSDTTADPEKSDLT